MTAFINRRASARAAMVPSNANAVLVVTGAEFLVSMVEARWTARNGDSRKMESGPKAKQELERIAEQMVKLESVDGHDDDTRRQIQALHDRVQALQKQVTAPRGAWEKTELARHPQRPYTLDYIERIFTDWSEIHGDRGFADDHQKARDTKQKVYRNFGMPNPEGYRKALRAMKIAEKFVRPVFTFVDTPGAYPGLGAEERGQSEAIARNLREMSRLRVPIITTIAGEGGSGGALAIAVADRVLMMENAVYSVISPEGCAAIRWNDATKKELAAQAMRITAPDLKELGCIDDTVPEPEGGAHTDHQAAATLLDASLSRHLAELKKLSIADLLTTRYDKFRKMAQFLMIV
jgi:acetyl-CoA carboxylase carboxyl transferase subunit alpha